MFRKATAIAILLLLSCGQTQGGVIPWDKAKDHIGETATVEGPVVTTIYASRSRGQPTFLNVGKPYPDKTRFTVVIWGRNRANFSKPPEKTYAKKTIRVTGLISQYRGVAQIEVRHPSAIKIVP